MKAGGPGAEFEAGLGGVVYTETVVHSAPEALSAEAPYQIAIVTMDQGGRRTGRITGARVAIGDRVRVLDVRDGVIFFGRS